jgi:predicted XRE-type DNA-binding protein
MSGKKNPRTRTPEHIAALFWAKVYKMDNGCWEWQAHINASGYGVFGSGVVGTWLAHRFAWSLERGAIPEEICCLHRCDNARCVNPNHLFLGTRLDNNQDRAVKGRGRNGIQVGENNNYAKLTEQSVREMRSLYEQGHLSQREIGLCFSVTQPTVSRIVRRLGWTGNSLSAR